MKITIKLSEQEEKGIKKYLSEVDNYPATKEDVKEFIQDIVTGLINAPQEAVSSYIAEQK